MYMYKSNIIRQYLVCVCVVEKFRFRFVSSITVVVLPLRVVKLYPVSPKLPAGDETLSLNASSILFRNLDKFSYSGLLCKEASCKLGLAHS